MKKVLLILVLLFFVSSINFAQFRDGKSHVGPSVSVGFSGWGVGFGADYEYGMSMKKLGIDAPGNFGLGGLVRYYSFSEGFGNWQWSYTNIIIGAQGNYHFALENKKIDPFLGLVLGFNIASSSWDGPNTSGWDGEGTSYGGMFLNLNAGLRYWFSPQMAVRANFGVGNVVSSLVFGLDFKF